MFRALLMSKYVSAKICKSQLDWIQVPIKVASEDGVALVTTIVCKHCKLWMGSPVTRQGMKREEFLCVMELLGGITAKRYNSVQQCAVAIIVLLRGFDISIGIIEGHVHHYHTFLCSGNSPLAQ